MIQVEDFKQDKESVEFAKLILDLYADVVLTGCSNRAAPSSNSSNAMQEFRKHVRENPVHEAISDKLAKFVGPI